jgi:hypothetical protein
MKNLSIVIVFCLISAFSLSANAFDMFTFSASGADVEQNSDGSLNQAPISFTAKFTAEAMEQERVVFNLPHKSISGIRGSTLGDISERITPYAFEAQKGFVVINSNNGLIESVVIFDREVEEVFRGTMQNDGSIEFSQVDINAFICTNFDEQDHDPSRSLQASNVSYYQSLNDLTLAQVTTLQSRPGASKVLYIDYLAGVVTDTAWNMDGGPTTITYADYSFDSDATTFSLIDLQSMYAGWAESADDFAPFDVNVTTDLDVYNAVSDRNRSKIVATSTNWFGGGGVAYVNIYGTRDDDFYNIGWTFNRSFGSLGMTNSHEAGHQMGLFHDGTSNLEYYDGAGNSGPIMGGPFNKDFVHWNNGTYPDANESQDDLTIIQGKLGVVTDDYGDNNVAALTIVEQDFIGFINPAGIVAATAADVDVFKFTLSNTTNVDLTVRNLFQQANNGSAGGLNLSAKIELKDSSNGLILQKLPSSNAANNDFSFSGSLSADTYYLTVQAQAYAGANFDEYGNGGYYQVLNNLPPPSPPDLVVEAPEVTDQALETGEAFTFSASVNNLGESISSATTLTYYLSDDNIIDVEDTNVGTDAVTALAANASVSQNIDLTAPANEGDYYYGACVSASSGEVNTDNNCSTSVLVSVNFAPTIDLIVESPSVDEANLETDQAFKFSVLVRNQGNSNASKATLTYYRSSDNIISVEDTNVGDDTVVALVANASVSSSINLTAPSDPGDYYYGACVNSVSGESNTVNNCSTAVLVSLTKAIVADQFEPDNDSLLATTLPNGEIQTHSIHQLGDEDWFTFTLSSPAKNLVIETSVSGDDDTRLWLYDEQIVEIAFNDDVEDVDNLLLYSRIALDAPLVAGTYYILADDFGSDDLIEAYGIQLSFTKEDTGDILDFLPAIISATKSK